MKLMQKSTIHLAGAPSDSRIGILYSIRDRAEQIRVCYPDDPVLLHHHSQGGNRMRKETAAGGISREEYVREECVRAEYVGTEDGASEKVSFSAGKDPFKEVQEKWESAGIGNDYLFSCVMRDESLFLQLMQRVFPELHLTKVWKHATQKSFLAMLGSKSIRLDVYSEINEKIFNVEMQLWSSRYFDPARRTRYYQSVIDEQSLQAGMLYRDLPDSYVVMFAPFDLFGKGRHCYRFRYSEEKDGSILLRDGTMKVFINSNGTGDDINEDLKAFLHLMNGGEPGDEFCRKVQESVEKAKMNPEVRRGFMEWEMERKMEQAVYYDRGVEKGREEGREEGMFRTLASLVQDQLLSLSEAADRLHMTEDEFRALL